MQNALGEDQIINQLTWSEQIRRYRFICSLQVS